MHQIRTVLKLGQTLNGENPHKRQSGALAALKILTVINLLNFADRYVPAAVKTDIQEDLNLSDFETALPNTGMVIVYMIAAVAFGYLADKRVADRRVLLSGGILFWSVATGLAGISQNLTQLIVFRSLVGVGEAAYGTIAPPMLFDFFPSADRNVVYGVYYLAIPVGAAVGYGVGATLATFIGWRWAFVAFAIPGVIAAISVLGLNNPVHGINDQHSHPHHQLTAAQAAADSQQQMQHHSSSNNSSGGNSNNSKSHSSSSTSKPKTRITSEASNPMVDSGERQQLASSSAAAASITSSDYAVAWHEVKEICSNKVFMLCVLGQAANNFALGGLADWVSSFLQRYDGVSLEGAGLVVGAFTVVGGIVGTLLGSKVTLHYDGKWKSAYFLVPALFTLPATLALLLALNINNLGVTYFLLFVFEVCIWTSFSPINTLSLHVLPAHLRARASGLNIFVLHILGDIISPPLIGYISDRTGNLRLALQMTWMAVLVSGLYWFVGWYFLPALPPMQQLKRMTAEDDEDEQLVAGGKAMSSAAASPSAAAKGIAASTANAKVTVATDDDPPPLTYSEVLMPWGDACYQRGGRSGLATAGGDAGGAGAGVGSNAGVAPFSSSRNAADEL